MRSRRVCSRFGRPNNRSNVSNHRIKSVSLEPLFADMKALQESLARLLADVRNLVPLEKIEKLEWQFEKLGKDQEKLGKKHDALKDKVDEVSS